MDKNTSRKGRKGKILVVDDDRVICTLLSTILGQKGYDVKTYNDGGDIIGIVGREKPDLMIFDISLATPPDGIELCRMVKQNEETKGIPLLMLTGNECIDSMQQCFSLGARDYLFKPIDIPELIRSIEKYLSPPEKNAK